MQHHWPQHVQLTTRTKHANKCKGGTHVSLPPLSAKVMWRTSSRHNRTFMARSSATAQGVSRREAAVSSASGSATAVTSPATRNFWTASFPIYAGMLKLLHPCF
jgi:hypothetical protein